MNNTESDLITLEELCGILMIGRSAGYQLLASGEIPCFRIGRIWKIPREGVDVYIRKQSGLS